MPIYLKQSTASQEVPLGYFVDSTDGNTEETGLTIANTDIKVWKTGATTLANKNSGGGTHISNGVYYAVLDATDTNTLGSLVLFCHVSGALPIRVECVVLAANVYDSLIGGGDVLDVSTTQFNGTAVTQSGGRPEVNVTHAAGTAWASGAITASALAADCLTAAKVAADVGTEIGTAVWATTTRVLTAGTNIALAKGTGVTGFNDLSAAEVNAEVDTALTDIHLDRLLAATYDPASKPGAVDALLNELVESDAGVSRFTANALEQAPSGGLDAAGVRAAVGLASANLDTQLSAIDTVVNSILDDTGTAGVVLGADSITSAKIADNAFSPEHFSATMLARMGVISSGTAQSATSTTVVLASAETFADDTLIGATILVHGSTQGYWQQAIITDNVLSTDTVTVDTWTVTPSGTITYVLFGTPKASTTAPVPASLDATQLAKFFNTDSGTTYASAVAGSVVKEVADNAGGSALTAAAIADAVWDEATAGHTTSGTFGEQCKTDIDAILVDTGTTLDGRIPAALVSGRMDVSVGAIAANAITAAATATDFGTEVGTAVWATTTRVLTAATNVTSTGAAVPITAGGLVSADVTAISTDTTAANNAESFFDGTGYAGTNNVIPTVTTLTGHTAQTGDAFARLGAPAGASVSADLAAVKAETASILTDTGTTLDGKIDTLLTADVAYKKAVAVTAFAFYMELTAGGPGTGLTVTAQISKDGGAFATLAGAVTEISAGWYEVDLSGTEMNADEIAFKATATGANQRNLKIRTQS